MICAVCSSQNSELVLTKKRYRLFRCRECSLIYVGNVPSNVRKLYSPAGKYQVRYQHSAKARKEFMAHCHRNYDFFKRFAHGSVLDVGCSIGGFLSLCKGRKGVGLEINAATAVVARVHFGLEVHECTLEEYHSQYPKKRFDNVTLWDVIEHLPDPNTTLEICHKVLRPGGKLFVDTSNADGLFARASFALRKYFGWYHPQPPYHLFQYGVRTLVRILQKHHFEIVETRLFPASYARKQSIVSLNTDKGFLYVLLLGPVDLLARALKDGDMVTMVVRKA